MGPCLSFFFFFFLTTIHIVIATDRQAYQAYCRTNWIWHMATRLKATKEEWRRRDKRWAICISLIGTYFCSVLFVICFRQFNIYSIKFIFWLHSFFRHRPPLPHHFLCARMQFIHSLILLCAAQNPMFSSCFDWLQLNLCYIRFSLFTFSFSSLQSLFTMANHVMVAAMTHLCCYALLCSESVLMIVWCDVIVVISVISIDCVRANEQRRNTFMASKFYCSTHIGSARCCRMLARSTHFCAEFTNIRVFSHTLSESA